MQDAQRTAIREMIKRRTAEATRSRETARDALIDEGVYTPEGDLTAAFGGAPDASAGTYEGVADRGRLTWLSSGEDEGPDVGLIVGLGDGHSLYIGELADQTLEEAGIDAAQHEGVGWWVALEGKGFHVVGPVLDADAGRDLADRIFAALKAEHGTNEPAQPNGTSQNNGLATLEAEGGGQ